MIIISLDIMIDTTLCLFLYVYSCFLQSVLTIHRNTCRKHGDLKRCVAQLLVDGPYILHNYVSLLIGSWKFDSSKLSLPLCVIYLESSMMYVYAEVQFSAYWYIIVSSLKTHRSIDRLTVSYLVGVYIYSV